MVQIRDRLMMLGILVALGHTSARADLIGPGDLAFTGWNSDAPDAFAFVVLSDVAPNSTVFFTDRPWDGSAFSGSEGTLTWGSPASSIAAGSVISVTDADSGSIAVNHGSIERSSGNLNLANSDEQTFAYLGSADNPTAFLAAFANDASQIILSNTGLADGTTAQIIDGDEDILAYDGPRFVNGPYSDFLALVGNDANWLTEDGTGNQSNNGTSPDLPFDTTPFATPEPSSFLLGTIAFGLLGAFGLLRRRQRT